MKLSLIAIAGLLLLASSAYVPAPAAKKIKLDANGNEAAPSLIKEISAKRKRHRRKAYSKIPGSDAGLIKSRKTGAQAWVHPNYVQRFQDYIDDLEKRDGVEIHYMGGWRRGRCSSGSQHPCGKALDVCQDSRGRTDHLGICHLPSPAEMAAVAKLHGLYEGSRWCDQDYGHAQVDPSGGDCPPKGWTAGVKFVGFLPTITGKLASLIKVASVEDAKPAVKKRHARTEVTRRRTRTMHARRHHRTRYASAQQASYYQQTAYYRQASFHYQYPGGDVQMRSRY